MSNDKRQRLLDTANKMADVHRAGFEKIKEVQQLKSLLQGFGFIKTFLKDLGYLTKETDPEFHASPASLVELQDISLLRTIPTVLAKIQKQQGPPGKQGDKGDKGDTVVGPRGPKGEPGDDAEAERIVQEEIGAHEILYDHSLIDPFLIGTKKISEAEIEDGKFLQYDKKTDKVIYAAIKPAATQIVRNAGSSLPSQSGNAGKVLSTDGHRASWVASSSTVNFADKEVPTGTIDGVNTVFTLAHTPTAGSDHIYLNGVLQTPTTDYSLAGVTITFVAAPQVGSDFTTVLLASYRY